MPASPRLARFQLTSHLLLQILWPWIIGSLPVTSIIEQKFGKIEQSAVDFGCAIGILMLHIVTCPHGGMEAADKQESVAGRML